MDDETPWRMRRISMYKGADPGRRNWECRVKRTRTINDWRSIARLLSKRVFTIHYLVTGGAGFIGSNIVDELVKRGQEVAVLDELSGGKEANLAGVRDKIDFHIGSVTDLAAVQSACKGVHYVIHLAARTSVPHSVLNPLETNHVNTDGTLNVLVAARDAQVRRFVFAASSAAYGERPTLPKIESMPAQPISPYGVTKYVGEIYSQFFGRVYGLENVSIRFFNVFGPRQDPTPQYSGVLSRFMLAVIEAQPPVIYGDDEQSRDFTYIENIVDETLRACEAAGASELTFNGGTGASITLNQMLKLLEKITGKTIKPKYEARRKGETRDSQADGSLAHKVLGYEPRALFEEGLKRTWDWYKNTYARA
jgi:nucleoside-diphosphate-sugar epimerase